MGWIVLAIGLVTLAAIVVHPRDLGEAWAAAAGATAMFLVGAIGPADLFATLRDTWDVLAFLLGMMALTWLADDAGVFDRVAVLVARGARLRAGAVRARLFAGGRHHRVAFARCDGSHPDAGRLCVDGAPPP